MGPAALREQARAAFAAAAQAEPKRVVPSALDLQLAQHGIIAPSLRTELRSRVLRDVIEPCARELLELAGAPDEAKRAARRGSAAVRMTLEDTRSAHAGQVWSASAHALATTTASATAI